MTTVGVNKMRLVHLVRLDASRAIKVKINIKDRIRDRVMVKISVKDKMWVGQR